MKTKLFAGFVVFGAMAFAASNTYKVDVAQDSLIEGKTLKAGQYKITVENGTATLKHGKDTIQVAAKQVTETSKVPATELLYQNGNTLQEIRLGGSNTSIVFDAAAPSNKPGM